MKPLTINQNSWHNSIIKALGFDKKDKWDICSYSRVLLFEMFLMLVFFAGVLIITLPVIAAPVLLILKYAYHFHNNGIDTALGFALIETCLYGMVSLVGLGAYWIKRYDSYNRKSTHKEPGFLVQAYRAFKNKYCFKINVQ